MLRRGMLITAEMLDDKWACAEQVEIFEEEWPDGAKLTKKNLLRAAELELGVDWFLCKFLPRGLSNKYEKQIESAADRLDKTETEAWQKTGRRRYAGFYRELLTPAYKTFSRAAARIGWELIPAKTKKKR